MDTTALLLGVIFSSVGLGYFIYGRKQKMSMPFVCGLSLMIFPYFIENTIFMGLTGSLLSIIPWLLRF
ncbi:amino acid transport protein [Acinetobacter sp. WCHAc010052]|uniref:amino acid transport protein n=1 Tax=Acinetobacter sp. WCHAc010052 TaxID=2004647 RepID=UPI000B3D048F|nr:amino acid transport protein [Acinetobacter sp. WCHAc010052]AXY60776.1 amino acid transport protein [Acinetobacter sp. WCHAc010052]